MEISTRLFIDSEQVSCIRGSLGIMKGEQVIYKQKPYIVKNRRHTIEENYSVTRLFLERDYSE